ncbi:Chloroperoxidase [Cyathus striatus]|nr:Chloroperoxidase [Cyathus striatus]
MARFFKLTIIISLLPTISFGFPQYASLAGLSERELDIILPTLRAREATPPPPAPNDTSVKLVNDKEHPWMPLKPGDMRGPCPGLNTLASHGWLPRSGVATPSQIVNAVQDGFGMEHFLAVFVTYAAMLVDGNLITDLMSIGGATPATGPAPPKPAQAGGLNTHVVFEGDASITRGDEFFGDNHSFNETLFDQFVDFSNRFGDGNYNLTVAAELRWQRIQQSMATNPQFSLVAPRYFSAYAESVFPLMFFVDGRKTDGQLDMTTARGFFQNNQMPDGFFRSNRSIVSPTELGEGMGYLFTVHPIQPGKNEGAGNYVLDPTSARFDGDNCLLYTNFVNQTVRNLYPNPKGALLDALNRNLDIFYGPMKYVDCPQVFPYGKP